MIPDLTQREQHLSELMDAPDCDAKLLFNTYRQFASINRMISGWRAIYCACLRPAMVRGQPYRLLDIGFGGGDIAISLANWARRDGFNLRVAGIDQDARAVQFVRAELPNAPVEFSVASTRELVGAGERFDFVVSNAVLHHLNDAAIREMADDAARLATRRVLHNDIRRSAMAYALFPLWAGVCFRNSYALADGLTSIRRSLTADELRGILPAGWRVERKFPFRLLAVMDPVP